MEDKGHLLHYTFTIPFEKERIAVYTRLITFHILFLQEFIFFPSKSISEELK